MKILLYPIHKSIVTGQEKIKATNDIKGVAITAIAGMLNKVITTAVTVDRTLKSVTKTTVIVMITGVILTIEIKISLRILVTS